MVFSSLVFLYIFLPLVFICYYTAPKKYRNFVLLLFSLLFYGWGEPLYLVIMLFSIVSNFFFGAIVGRYRDTNPKRARLYVALSVVFNLLMLGFFKYANFITDNLRQIPFLSGIIPTLAIALPIGISFYTFQSMSYAIDIYRRDVDVQKSFVSFATYVTLFSQLIAGPIIRYKTINDQLDTRVESIPMFHSGITKFLVGLSKKVLLANSFGLLWETMAAIPTHQQSVLGSWIGIIAFAFQIYFDFGGYSDMAVGLGRMFGFEFQINFFYPYLARSITDFWAKRWHISLGTWFKEYLYIPLGGNRRSIPRNYINILIVWFLTGLWHGAHWNFILWGLYYALLLIIEKAFLLRWLKKVPAFFSTVYTLFFVIMGWVIFSFVDLSAMGNYFGNMFGVAGAGLISNQALYALSGWWPMLLIGVVASTPMMFSLTQRISEKLPRVWSVAEPLLCLGALVLCTAYIVGESYNPFLYFRF